MASESKSFPAILPFPQTGRQITLVRGWVLWLQIALVYALIVLASWTSEGRWKVSLMLTTAAMIAGFALCGRYTAREMGLGISSSQGAVVILGWGLLLAACIPAGSTFRLAFSPNSNRA